MKQKSGARVELEFWADSFHEGDWACKQLAEHLELQAFHYADGVIPIYRYSIDDIVLEVTVLGSYRSWSTLPEPVSQLLDWGKPDLVVFDPVKNTIVAAVEETAATPTGNQALQRCERTYGSARAGVPMWYLLPEYGLHVDGGERRDSIWPTVLALKLTAMFGIPSVVLHYAEKGKPEAYDAGTGVRVLFGSLANRIKVYLGLADGSSLVSGLEDQYGTMLSFIRSQWQEMTRFLPGEAALARVETARAFALRALGQPLPSEFAGFIAWPRIAGVPSGVRKSLKPGSLLKHDAFLERLEATVGTSTYTLSDNAGSRPQPVLSVREWIRQQQQLSDYSALVPRPTFSLNVADFPESKSGLLHVTTAKNILYLCDEWSQVVECISGAYARLKKLLGLFPANTPTMVYVSNSLLPGRIFGDPFTGQLTAYAATFARSGTGKPNRIVLAYYPHQVHNQLFDKRGEFKKNKGITLMRELVDIAVFHAGVAVVLKSGAAI